MLYTTIKRRGRDLACEVHVIGNIIELRNFYRSIRPGNYVRYTAVVPMTLEDILIFLNKIVECVKEGVIYEDHRFRIEKHY